MVENKEVKEVAPKSPQKKTKKTTKATTGAWWKSTVKKEETKRKTSATKSAENRGRKAGSAKSRSSKTAAPVSPKRKAPQKASRKEPAPKTTTTISPVEKEPRAEKKVARKEPAGKKPGEKTVQDKLPKRTVKGPGRKRFLKKAWEKGKAVLAPLATIIGVDDVAASASLDQPVEDAPDKEVPATDSVPVSKDTPAGKRKPGRPRKGKRGQKPGDPSKTSDLAGGKKSNQTQLQKEESLETGPKPVIKLLINAEEPEECRLALLEDGRLESINVSTVTRTQTKNNIYKAKIVAIEPNLQAAFVDYGTDKNGFLPFSEIHPEYYKQNVSEKAQHLIDTHQWKKLSISEVIEKGQEVLAQVVKEEVGKKGANMTTYLSLPGRCVVLMPGSDSTGISRKILGEERRSQLREIMKSMDIPEGIGWIVRTASIDITKTALSRDVGYLLRLWAEVKKKGQTLNGVGIVYQDQNSVLRFLREHFDPAIQEILVDDKTAMEQVKEFTSLLPSKQRTVKVKLHRGSRPIFNQFSVEDQIESIYQPHVNLPSGGSIVIDPTEALVAIDVNSGSTSKGQNFEASIFQANIEAAAELARQLRLRDLGGLIVVDFIDMRSKKNIREVEKQVKIAMKSDKAKVDVSRISKFGLMQISRQKLGAPIEAGNYRVCEHCKGRGTVRSVETLALFYLRRIQTGASRKMVQQVECRFPLDVAQYLLNNKRQELRDLEVKYGTEVTILANPALKPADNEIIFHKGEKESKA